MAVASHSILARTVKTSQPGGVNTTMIARVKYYSNGADSFHCCLLWSSKHTENCISFQPFSMGWLLLHCLLRHKPKPHQGLPVGHCFSPLRGLVKFVCTDTAFEFQELQESNKTSCDLENSLHCCIFLEALAIYLPDQTPLSVVGLVLQLSKDEKSWCCHVLLSQILWARKGEWAEPVLYAFSVKRSDRFEMGNANRFVNSLFFNLCSTEIHFPKCFLVM